MTLNRDRHPEMLESGSQLEVSDILCIGAGGSHQAKDWCLSEPRASWLTKEGVPLRILWKLTPACMQSFVFTSLESHRPWEPTSGAQIDESGVWLPLIL